MIDPGRLERARHFLEPALEYTRGTHTFSDVARDLDTGRAQLWDTDRAAAVTQVLLSPRRKTCHLFLAGGELAELERILTAIEKWAKIEGCDQMTLAGRPGWTKTFLRDRGYSAAWVTMQKELA